MTFVRSLLELSRAMRKGLKAENSEDIKATIDEECWDVIYYALAIADDSTFHKLGMNLTCEPQYQTKKLYHK
mgnify:CR=1 FL=1